MTTRALQRVGFSCDGATDGAEAWRLVESHRYDVVVTDLQMPHRHGHALACDLLRMEDRPRIVILTGVLEPRLAQDLIARGVDCIEFKPVHYPDFAAKVRDLVDQQAREAEARREADELAVDPPLEAESEPQNDTVPQRSQMDLEMEDLVNMIRPSSFEFPTEES